MQMRRYANVRMRKDELILQIPVCITRHIVK